MIELLTFGVSFFARAFQTHLNNNQEIRKKELEAMNTRNNLVSKGQKQIREHYQTGLLGITASILAVTAFFSIILLPKLCAIFFPDVSISLAYFDTSKGFLFFSSDITKLFFKQFSGIIITPMDTNLIAAIAGLYFGSLRTSMRRY